jgi:enoyl-CoA hydratase/carnithine racemase
VLVDATAGLHQEGVEREVFETFTVRKEEAVLFADIAAPPMNLLGPALVRDLVSLIQVAETVIAIKVLVFRSADPDYFIPHVDVTRERTKEGCHVCNVTDTPSYSRRFRSRGRGQPLARQLCCGGR